MTNNLSRDIYKHFRHNLKNEIEKSKRQFHENQINAKTKPNQFKIEDLKCKGKTNNDMIVA